MRTVPTWPTRRRGTPSRDARRWRRQRGAAAVEFALILPILLMLVFGIIDFGLYINAAAVVGNAAREGARSASLGATSAQVEGVVGSALGSLPGDPLDNATIDVSCRTPAGGACSSFDAGAASGGTAVVDVTYLHEWLTPLGFGSGITIGGSSEMRIE